MTDKPSIPDQDFMTIATAVKKHARIPVKKSQHGFRIFVSRNIGTGCPQVEIEGASEVVVLTPWDFCNIKEMWIEMRCADV